MSAPTSLANAAEPEAVRLQHEKELKELRDTLVDAVDCSAAYSLKNPDWARLAPKEGIPVKPPPEKSGEDKYGING